MPSVLKFGGQAVFLAAIAVVVGYFSASPRYHQIPEGQSQIKLAIQHGGARIEDCRKLTTKELSKLPSTERRPITCSRERVALTIELSIDGKVIYADVLPPTGLSGDGVSKAYKKFLVPALAIMSSKRSCAIASGRMASTSTSASRPNSSSGKILPLISMPNREASFSGSVTDAPHPMAQGF